ncbi:FAD-binding domain-containing protein [Periconia macrospinosa]|uniref:FAD-binding domain-containing protein n=1 Tax=Periconia macrospinosa TaxID=97972 RepID=A0A2V1DLI6_9PLEO|nr:FAD-binding domain-containing protein [Periconia macrospinosa]
MAFLLLYLLVISSIVPISFQIIENNVWNSLNQSLHGRLRKAYPFAIPCFSSYESHSIPSEPEMCSDIKQNYRSPAFRTEHFSGFMNSQSEICLANSIEQCLLDNTDSNSAIPANSTCFQGNVPSYYVEVGDVQDVITAFQFAKLHGITVSIKNTGHDYLTRNTLRSSLSIWTHHLRHLSFSPNFSPAGCHSSHSYQAITVGAGVNFDELYTFAEEHNSTSIGGYASTVGASGGWLLGGGHSNLSPVYGLGVDRVVEITLVTPDGALRTVNNCQDPDLFWALRGGGGGSFGVVISSTSTVEPRMPVAVASVSYVPRNNSEKIAWIDMLINSSLAWGLQGWGGHITGSNFIHTNPLLNLSAATESMRPAINFANEHNGTAVIEVLPSWYAFYKKYVIPLQRGVGEMRFLSTRLIPASMFEKATSRRQLLSFFEHVVGLGIDPYIPVTTPFIYPYTPNSTSATPAWRNSLWHVSTSISIPWNSSDADRLTALAKLTRLTKIKEELAPKSGAYVNEANPFTQDWKKAWWGDDNYERLLKVKRRVDREGVLKCWKCVGFDEYDKEGKFRCLMEMQRRIETSLEREQ